MPLIDTIDWTKIADVDSVTVRGASIKDILIKRLEEFDDRFAYGRCSPDDLPRWLAERWQPLKWQQFGSKSIDDFNAGVGLRLGIRADLATGYVMNRRNILMYMDKKRRAKIEEYRNEASERAYASAMDETTRSREERIGDDSPEKTQIAGTFDQKTLNTRDKKAVRDFEKDWSPLSKE